MRFCRRYPLDIFIIKFYNFSGSIKYLDLCTGNFITACSINLADTNPGLSIINKQSICSVSSSGPIYCSIRINTESRICFSYYVSFRCRYFTKRVICLRLQPCYLISLSAGNPLLDNVFTFQDLDRSARKFLFAVYVSLADFNLSLLVSDCVAICYTFRCGGSVANIAGLLLDLIGNLLLAVILRQVAECCRPGFALAVLVRFSVKRYSLAGRFPVLEQF